MKLAYALTSFALLLVFHGSAQERTIEQGANSIENQFVDVVDKSNSFKFYKVIPKAKIARLRKNVSDSLKRLEVEIASLKREIETRDTTVSTLKTDLGKTNEELALSLQKENSIAFFGASVKKTTYKTIMWSIVTVLALLLLFFIYKFKNSHTVTKHAGLKLAETEAAFEAHRQKTLDRDSELRRKLQDEINKNRKTEP